LRVDKIPALIEILNNFESLIQKKKIFLWKKSHENPPESFDLSYSPVISAKTVERKVDKSACTLCEKRISYKKDQFKKQIPKLPYLFVVHNDFVGPQSQIYHQSEENSLFEKMISTTLKIKPSDVLIRELLRCHFSKEDIFTTQVIANCQNHIERDILDFKIKGMLIFGKAASLLYQDKSELSKKSENPFELFSVKTMICPGPNRLVYMREKKMPQEQIDAERRKIFDTLNRFKVEIM